MVARHDLTEMPPRMEYKLTEFGKGLLTRMIPLWTLMVQMPIEFQKHQEGYDARPNAKPSWQTL
ncbi:hypothetical protein [Oryzifoliimicrobium ureilyticus]|uniref:hypothetical protein n=1 Tax=Oryzifoliimicrobium ureilyticus TaxID=3113724 RepID=UPI003076235A